MLMSKEVIFMVAKNGYGTEPSLRFSTYEEAEKQILSEQALLPTLPRT